MRVGGELEGDVFGEAPGAVLGGVVVGEADHRGVEGVDRGDVDDPAAAVLLDHPRRRGPREQVEAGQVDLDDALEGLRVQLAQRRHRIDPGVVDEDVEAAERLDRRADRPLDVARVADVAAGRPGASCPPRPHILRGLLGGRLVEVRDHDVRAGLVQAAADAEPDAHRASGDDRRAAAEVDQVGQWSVR